MKNKRRQKWMAAILLVVTIFALSGICDAPAYANNESLIELNIEAGFGEIARSYRSMPVDVTISNNGSDLSGELQVELLSDNYQKVAYAKKIEVAAGTTKKIQIIVPVTTSSKDFVVKVTDGRKVITEKKHSLIKILGLGGNTVIGVLSDDLTALNILNGLQLGANTQDIPEEKLKLMMASGEIQGIYTKTEMIPLNHENFPDDADVLRNFDVLYMSNFDTSLLSDTQLNALKDWVEEGHILVLGLGESWQKLYKSLPEQLIPYKPENLVVADMPDSIQELLFEKVFESLPSGVEIAKGAAGNGALIAGDTEHPLMVRYFVEDGVVAVFTFDIAKPSLNRWSELGPFVSALMNQAGSNETGLSLYNSSTYFYQSSNYNWLASQVPQEKQPPYKMIAIMLGIYILIAGPILYIVLKVLDKRDFSWVLIPAAALICVLIIYVAGFKTRYTTAVMNNVSTIVLNEAEKQVRINSTLAAFNNKKGTLSMSYGADSGIVVQVQDNYYDPYGYRVYSLPQSNMDNVPLASKMTLSQPVVYELYNVYMWTPKYVQAKKSIPVEDLEIIKNISVANGRVSGLVDNTSGFDMNQAFIVIGNRPVYLGDILAGQQMSFDASLDKEDEESDLQSFLDKYYGSTQLRAGQKAPDNFREIVRKRNLMEAVLNRGMTVYGAGHTVMNNMTIRLFAYNFNDIGYDIQINDQYPEIFHANVIMMDKALRFEKSSRVEIPAGFIVPYLTMEGKGAYYDYSSGYGYQGIRVEQKGNVDMIATMPQNIELDRVRIEFSTFLPYYARLMMLNQGNNTNNPFPIEILKNEYAYYVYNLATDQWEEVDSTFEIHEDIEHYVNSLNQLQIRIEVVEMAEYGSGGVRYEREVLSMPDVSIEGVAR